MKINLGLLLCDHVPERLQPAFQDYPSMYKESFQGLGAEISWKIYDVCHGKLPSQIDDLDGYIVSGSRFSVNDKTDWIKALEAFLKILRRNKLPIVGICFGHQLIAKAFGGQVNLSESGWGVGCKKFHLTETKDWIPARKKNFIVPAFHQEQIVSLPKGANTIGSTDYCANFLVEFDDYILGIQGHPEFEKEYIAALLDERIAIMPQEVTSDAKCSLNLLPDSDAIKRGILNFLRMP